MPTATVDTASINLGTGVFQIQDDGPNAVVANAMRRRWCWTRRGRSGPRRPATALRRALTTVTANLADNFAAARLRHRRSWQRDLFAGSDRFERGVRAVCAGCDATRRGRRRRHWPGRRSCSTRSATPSPARSARRLLHDQHRRGDGPGDVHADAATSGTPTPATMTNRDADAVERRPAAAWCRR